MKKLISLFLLISMYASCNNVAQLTSASKATAKDPTTNNTTVEESVPNVRVFGQINAHESRANMYQAKVDGLYFPSGSIKVGDKWAVLDNSNNRILIFSSEPPAVPILVLGQRDFTSGVVNGPDEVISASTLNGPNAIASDGFNLIVADSSNHRILIWNTFPTSSFQAADVVIGQPDFTTNTAPTSPTDKNMNTPYGIAVAGGKLYVVDAVHHRVLIYNSIPTQNYQAADAVLGQSNFTSSSANRGGAASSSSLNIPYGISTNGSKLAVADYANHRILVWNSLPSSDGAADVVVGQPDFTTVTAGTTQAKLNYPTHAEWNGSDLYVADSLNNRILLWSNLVASGTAGNAGGIFGQANYTSSTANGGLGTTTVSSGGVYSPGQISIHNGRMFIADRNNNRILKFNSPLTGVNTAIPSAVLGQANFTEQRVNRGYLGPKGFRDASCMAISKKYLLVGSRNRVLVFDKFAKTNAPDALAVIGQPDFTVEAANAGSIGAKTLNTTGCGLALDSEERLYVADKSNNRILVFNSIPTVNFVSADFVIGQPSFVASTAAATQAGLNSPSGIAVHGNKLWVADSGYHRVLAYDLPITQDGPLATTVLGQTDYTTVTSGLTAAKFNTPIGVAFDSHDRLYVMDSSNSRVLVWNTIPTGTTNPSANIVLGQADFTSNVGAVATNTFTKAGSSGNYAQGMAFLNGHVLIPDSYGNRILGFDGDNLATGMSATYVWGQTSFTLNDTYPFGKGDSFGTLYSIMDAKEDPYDDFVWLSSKFAKRLFRVKKAHFWEKKI